MTKNRPHQRRNGTGLLHGSCFHVSLLLITNSIFAIIEPVDISNTNYQICSIFS